MARRVDWEHLWRTLSRYSITAGPASSSELVRALGISQATFSRLVANHAQELLVVGRARSTRYALRRAVPDVGPDLPIFEVDERGGARQLARLHAVAPARFYVEAMSEDVDSRFYDDLPYFLHDLRPSGFLGRLVPAQHPELGLPEDVRHWSSDQTLRFLVRFGSNLPGSLIVGESAFQHHLEGLRSLAPAVAKGRRAARYEQLAEDVLGGAPPGSSAGGEQPKFLARRLPGPTDVLVKFSPPVRDATGTRHADLLVAEHLAHGVLRAHGQSAAKSEIVEGMRRVFLEVERFDRTTSGGRRGVISLLSLDAEFLGRLRRWSESGDELARVGYLDGNAATGLRWLEWFGRLIANTDMHFGNVSFFMRGTRVVGLAPTYDMCPMLYAPRPEHRASQEFVPPTPEPSAGPIWTAVCDAAEDYWGQVASHPLVSTLFRRIASDNQAVVGRARSEGRRLPR